MLYNKKQIKRRLNIYILDCYLNNELKKFLNLKYNVFNEAIGFHNRNKINTIDIAIVSNVENISLGIEIVDILLSKGKDIICVLDENEKSYLARHLIKDGAINI